MSTSDVVPCLTIVPAGRTGPAAVLRREPFGFAVPKPFPVLLSRDLVFCRGGFRGSADVEAASNHRTNTSVGRIDLHDGRIDPHVLGLTTTARGPEDQKVVFRKAFAAPDGTLIPATSCCDHWTFKGRRARDAGCYA